MKYLVVPEVQAADSLLEHLNTADAVIQGKLEAYSCKRVGSDKKLASTLERQYSDQSGAIPCGGSIERTYSGFTPVLTSQECSPRDNPDDFTLSESPGVMSRSASSSSQGVIPDANMRRLFVNLLLTLNTIFPDYDFRRPSGRAGRARGVSSVRPEEFVEELNYELVANSINASLQKAMAVEPTLAPTLRQAIDTIRPQDCFIFSYVPAAECPLSESCIWSFNYFFYNKELKRVLFFSCTCSRIMINTEAADAGMSGYGSYEDEQQMDFDMEDCDL